jgi:hypothetical protein
LEPDDFSLDSHRRVFSRMVDLADSSRPIDMITLVEELDRRKELEAIGDVGYVSGLVDGVPDRPSIKHYVDIVLEKSLRRKMVRRLEVLQNAASGDGELPQMEKDVEVLLRHLQTRRNGSRIHKSADIPCVLTLPAESVPYLVPDLLVRGAVTLINGDPGVGKSFLALKIAVATALGGNFLGFTCEQAPCWILDKENPLGLTQQRLKLLAGGSVDPDLKIWGVWLVDQPPMLGDGRLLKMASAEKPLIVFDSLIRFHDADENDASEMRNVMSHARALAAAGATVLILHHKPKSQEVRYRGSSDILAGVDMAYTLEADGQGQLKLDRFKNRFGPERLFTIATDFAAGKFTLTSSDAAIERREDLAILRDIIGRTPGLSQNKIIEIAGLNRNRARDLLTKQTGSLWEIREGANRSRFYYPKNGFPVVSQVVPDTTSDTTSDTTL